MYYFKKYEKKKNKITVKNIIEIFIFIFIIYEVIGNRSSKIKSNTIKSDNIEEIIEIASENVVGISKNDISGNAIWGSGVVISKKGYILTNEHIAGEKNENCYVFLNYNKKIKAKVVWTDDQIDLAILKVNYEFEKCETIGNSENLKVGKKVYSI